MAALKAKDKENDPILLVLSSDHIIDDELEFQPNHKNGIKEANKGDLVTFGVVPSSPGNRVMGILKHLKINKKNYLSRIKKFVENQIKKLQKKC